MRQKQFDDLLGERAQLEIELEGVRIIEPHSALRKIMTATWVAPQEMDLWYDDEFEIVSGKVVPRPA